MGRGWNMRLCRAGWMQKASPWGPKGGHVDSYGNTEFWILDFEFWILGLSADAMGIGVGGGGGVEADAR